MAEVFGFDRRGTRRVVETVRGWEGTSRTTQGAGEFPGFFIPDDQHIWWGFRNDSGEEIPAYSVIKITGYDSEIESLKADQPDEFGFVSTLAINAGEAVPAGSKGICTFTFPAWVAYDNGDTPAVGEQFGPVASQWTAKLRSPGLTVVAVDTDDEIVLVERNHMLSVLFEYDSGTIAQDATGTASVHYYNASNVWTEETDTTHNVTVRNVSDFDMTNTIRGAANWDQVSGQWIGLPLECE